MANVKSRRGKLPSSRAARQADRHAQQAGLVRKSRKAAVMAAQARAHGRHAEAVELEARVKRLQTEAAQAAAQAGMARGLPWRAQRLPPRGGLGPEVTIDREWT